MWYKKSSLAFPFSSVLLLLGLWLLVCAPLVAVGSFYGFKGEEIKHPVRINNIPRQIPPQPWYMHPALSALVGGILPFGSVFIELYFIMSSLWLAQIYLVFGFLAMVLLILVVTCAEISIVMVRRLGGRCCGDGARARMRRRDDAAAARGRSAARAGSSEGVGAQVRARLLTLSPFPSFPPRARPLSRARSPLRAPPSQTYFQLCSEDYNWWWRSFLTSGSSALYLFLYSAVYFHTKLEITQVASSVLFFGYMAMISWCFFLMTGAVGFVSSLTFANKIYAAIKVD